MMAESSLEPAKQSFLDVSKQFDEVMAVTEHTSTNTTISELSSIIFDPL